MKLFFDDKPPDLVLGEERVAWWTCWKPDRELNPQYVDLPDEPRLGLLIQHGDLKENGTCCFGGLNFDCEVARRVFPNQARWTVEKWEPLTLSPSILVHGCCHGWIRDGKWVVG